MIVFYRAFTESSNIGAVQMRIERIHIFKWIFGEQQQHTNEWNLID